MCFLINIFDVFINKNIKIAKLFKKNISNIVITKKFATFDKTIIFEEILSNIQVFNTNFVDEKNQNNHKTYEKRYLQAYNLNLEFFI